MDDFIPYDGTFGTDPNILIEDFPDYLLEKIQRWIKSSMRNVYLLSGVTVSSTIVEPLEFRLRKSISSNIGSFLAEFTSDIPNTRNILSLLLQNYVLPNDADILKELLKNSSSAYTVEPIDHLNDQGNGGYILVRKVSEAERLQAQPIIDSNPLLHQAYIECYKIDPNYPEAVRKSSDHIEGLLTRKFWSERTATISIHVATEKFSENPDLLHFKGDTFVQDKSKVIGLLDGIARIRDEHTSGTGRAPTSDEAEFVVQTAIYLHSLLEPIVPSSLSK